jgi:hypothetical protein
MDTRTHRLPVVAAQDSTTAMGFLLFPRVSVDLASENNNNSITKA